MAPQNHWVIGYLSARATSRHSSQQQGSDLFFIAPKAWLCNLPRPLLTLPGRACHPVLCLHHRYLQITVIFFGEFLLDLRSSKAHTSLMLDFFSIYWLIEVTWETWSFLKSAKTKRDKLLLLSETYFLSQFWSLNTAVRARSGPLNG